MHNVLIVDDSATSREVLRAILCEEAGFNVVGFAKDGREAVEKAKELHPDFDGRPNAGDRWIGSHSRDHD